jgi:hypothetical protein
MAAARQDTLWIQKSWQSAGFFVALAPPDLRTRGDNGLNYLPRPGFL